MLVNFRGSLPGVRPRPLPLLIVASAFLYPVSFSRENILASSELLADRAIKCATKTNPEKMSKLQRTR
jgi:hypothetical protein